MNDDASLLRFQSIVKWDLTLIGMAAGGLQFLFLLASFSSSIKYICWVGVQGSDCGCSNRQSNDVFIGIS